MCWLCRPQAGATDDGVSVAGTLRADQPLPTAPRFQFSSAGHAGVDGVLSGYAWSMEDPVSFAFPDSGADYEAWYGTSEPTRGFTQVSAAMRDAVRQILVGDAAAGPGGGPGSGPGSPGPGVAGFTNLTILESTEDWAADMRFAKSSVPSTAWAYYPNGREGGDVWFGNRAAYDTPKLGSYQFLVAVHEIGHALGLKHPHESWNGFGPMPLEWDRLENTVMSYRSHAGVSTSGGYVNGAFDYPQGWMILDIAALQHLYGADYSMQAGNTVYSWNPATGETMIDGVGQGAAGTGGAGNRVFLTVWDGGGVDSYDLSAYAGGVAVDLAPGAASVTASAQLALLDNRAGLEVKAKGNVYNALLHRNDPTSLIENAAGGVGGDTLAGNDAMNHLAGGAGRDLLEGRAGDDVLDGGAGADTLRGGVGHDRYLVDDAGDLVLELALEGSDTVVSRLVATTLPEAVEVLVLGAGAVAGIGNGLANLLTGNATANRLEGRGGADVLEGGSGGDTLLGGAGADVFVLRRGDDFDRIEDFATGIDKLALTGFGRSAADILALAREVSGGLRINLGEADGVLLAGLFRQQFSAADLIV